VRRRETPLRELGGDLWRLAALRRGVARGLFRVEPESGSAGRLVLTSRVVGEHAARELPPGRPAEVIWNHSLVGETVPLLGAAGLPSRVGEHGIAGAHAFRSLGVAMQKEPVAAAAVLAPVLTPRAD
jgi:hypothetical protein